jgi:hypothetical protein
LSRIVELSTAVAFTKEPLLSNCPQIAGGNHIHWELIPVISDDSSRRMTFGEGPQKLIVDRLTSSGSNVARRVISFAQSAP